MLSTESSIREDLESIDMVGNLAISEDSLTMIKQATEVDNDLEKLKTVIRQGWPEAFQEFAIRFEFKHITSSPGYPKSNGKSENAVRTAKRLVKKAKKSGRDPYLIGVRIFKCMIWHYGLGSKRLTTPTPLSKMMPQ